MKYLLDTSVLSDFVKGNKAVVERIKTTQPQQLAISNVTVMEIEYGLKLYPGKGQRIRPAIDGLLSAIISCPILYNRQKPQPGYAPT